MVKQREISQKSPISTVITHREHESSPRQRGIRTNNLTRIQPHSWPIVVEKSLLLAVINCRSLNKNGIKLKDHIVEHDCDIIAVTETWLPCEDLLAKQIIGDVCPEGYKMSHIPRSSGGGIGILYKTCLDIRVADNCQPTNVKYNTFEHAQHLLNMNSKRIRIITIYRPPPSTTNGLTTAQFFFEFAMFLEHLISLSAQIVIVGDVNLHLENTSNNQTRKFLELLDTLNLSQLVNQPTHRLGHTLDCIITEQDANLVNDICVHTPWISDHSLVAFKLSVQKPAVSYKTVITRDWKSLNLDQLNYEITRADFRHSSNVVSECVYHYDNNLRTLLDVHAPSRSRTILMRPRAPWFTRELSEEKREKRRLEGRYRSTGTTADAVRFKDHCARYCRLLSVARESFYNSKILESSGDQKVLFSVVNKLLHRTSEAQLPVYDNLSELTNSFANFFVDKISMIRSTLDSSPSV